MFIGLSYFQFIWWKIWKQKKFWKKNFDKIFFCKKKNSRILIFYNFFLVVVYLNRSLPLFWLYCQFHSPNNSNRNKTKNFWKKIQKTFAENIFRKYFFENFFCNFYFIFSVFDEKNYLLILLIHLFISYYNQVFFEKIMILHRKKSLNA